MSYRKSNDARQAFIDARYAAYVRDHGERPDSETIGRWIGEWYAILCESPTLEDVAARFDVTYEAAKDWRRRGYFPNARQIERVWRIPEYDLDSFRRPLRGRPAGKESE